MIFLQTSISAVALLRHLRDGNFNFLIRPRPQGELKVPRPHLAATLMFSHGMCRFRMVSPCQCIIYFYPRNHSAIHFTVDSGTYYYYSTRCTLSNSPSHRSARAWQQNPYLVRFNLKVAMNEPWPSSSSELVDWAMGRTDRHNGCNTKQKH